MPFYIRRLPCASYTLLVDEKKLPEQICLYNPSKTKEWMYIRKTDINSEGQTNSILMKHTNRDIIEIKSPFNELSKTVNLFKGLEDLRICEFNGRIWFGATCTHASDNMCNELVIGFFNNEVTTIEKFQMVDIGSKPVKNVIPFVYDNKILLLDIYLRKIYELHINDDKWTTTVWRSLETGNGISKEFYRGSTGPIHISGTIYGCISHDIIFNDNIKLITRLSYLHHWIEFDIETGLITFVSSPFWIYHWGIEYVSGIEKMENGTIELYLGLRDKVPMKVQTTLSDLRIGK
jgi:hypothetical protein